MFGTKERLLTYEETNENGYAVKARNDDGEDVLAEGHDAPPEMFVERISHDGGDVYVSPMIEALRRVFRRRKSEDADEEPAEAAATPTVPCLPENAEGAGGARQ